MEDRLSFSKIHIIEWLKPTNRRTGEDGDRRTGEETDRELKTLIPASGSRMDVILHRVSSRATFVKRLGRLEEDFRASRKVPLLQIETHGVPINVCREKRRLRGRDLNSRAGRAWTPCAN